MSSLLVAVCRVRSAIYGAPEQAAGSDRHAQPHPGHRDNDRRPGNAHGGATEHDDHGDYDGDGDADTSCHSTTNHDVRNTIKGTHVLTVVAISPGEEREGNAFGSAWARNSKTIALIDLIFVTPEVLSPWPGPPLR